MLGMTAQLTCNGKSDPMNTFEAFEGKQTQSEPSEIVPFHGVMLHLDTDQIAVWEEHFEPEELTEVHRHTRDYLCVALTDIDLTVEPILGAPEEQLTVLVGADKTRFDRNRGRLPRGTVFHSRVSTEGAVHTAFNHASTKSKLLIIELKGTGMESE